jgi:hypothetical protein
MRNRSTSAPSEPTVFAQTHFRIEPGEAPTHQHVLPLGRFAGNMLLLNDMQKVYRGNDSQKVEFVADFIAP